MNSPLRNWSLRNRLTAGVLALSAIGFIGAGLVVQKSLQGYLIGQIDEQLISVVGGTSQRLNAAGIANDGVVMNPYLISQVLGPDLTVLQNTNPSAFGRAMSVENSKILRDMMVGVVTNGTASKAAISGISVGGKTGTAENAPGEPAHAWFVGLAPSEESRVAVAVVLQNGGGATEVSGNSLAAPIAAAVMRAVLKQ